MKRILITGSNRGIGLEFTRQYLEAGWRVYATCRRPSEAQSLKTLTNLHSELSVHRLDITQQEDISNLCLDLKDITLDILINNANVNFENRKAGVECIHYSQWLRALEVNTLGPVRIIEALLDNITRNDGTRLVVVVSSNMRNIKSIDEFGSIYYLSSKAALNIAMQYIAVALRPRKVGVLHLHPGGVKTLLGPGKDISKRESVDGMRQVIESFSMDMSGAFIQYDGTPLAW